MLVCWFSCFCLLACLGAWVRLAVGVGAGGWVAVAGLVIYMEISQKWWWVVCYTVFMARSVLSYKDAVVVPFPNPDDPRLAKVHKKGFVELVKGWRDDEVEEWASLYPAWYMRGFRRMAVLWFPDRKVVRVSVPKTRAHRADHYAWVRYLPLPEGGYWYLLTLTFYREVGFNRAWANVNRWTSKFLNRFRTYLRTVFRVNPSYLWVVEDHEDGFPHVHVLFRMPFIQELNFQRLLSMFQSYWVDDDGKPLCAPHGVDLKYIGRNVQQVREYVLEYLVKNHHKYWRVELLPNGLVAYRRSTTRMWLYKVRLFGMSQDIRAMVRERFKREKGRGEGRCVFYGSVSANRVHKLYYQPLGIPAWYWFNNLPEICYMEYSDSRLPELCPWAFGSRAGPDVFDELVENF